MSEQLSLLDWRPPAQVIAFPLHRSHGLTVCLAREFMALETAKRTGRLNSLRAQTRKRLEPLVGFDAADQAADDLVRKIKIAFDYCEKPSTQKQNRSPAVILSLRGFRNETVPHGDGAGAAGALGQGTKFLAGFGVEPHEEPTEFGTTRARDGGAA